MTGRRLLPLLPLLLAACAPVATVTQDATPAGQDFGVHATGTPTPLTQAPMTRPVSATTTAQKFAGNPTSGYPGYDDAFAFPVKKNAVANELQALHGTLDTVPYDPDASRASLLRFVALNNALKAQANTNLEQIMQAITNDSFTDYLFQFPGTRTRYNLAVYRHVVAAQFDPSYTEDQRLLKTRSEIATIKFEGETARQLIAYNGFYADYADSANADARVICALKKFNCQK